MSRARDANLRDALVAKLSGRPKEEVLQAVVESLSLVLSEMASAEAERLIHSKDRHTHAGQSCPVCSSPIVGKLNPARLIESMGLARQQKRIALKLCAHFGQWVGTDELLSAVYYDDPNGGPMSAQNCVSVGVIELRKALAPYGLRIDAAGKSGVGRRLVWAGRTK